MESMRSSEANNSHHPNKVAVNSVVTESNNKSSGSGSLNNNNNNNTKISYSLQQQHIKSQLASTNLHKPTHLTTKDINIKLTSSSSSGSSTPQSSSSSNPNTSSAAVTPSSTSSTSSESKDTNFEYDDNEWDVGGIGDLIIDLDADIEKSASTTTSATQQASTESNLQQISNKSSSVSNLPSNNNNKGSCLNANDHPQSGAICSSSSSSTSLSSRSSSSNSLSSASSSTSSSSNPCKSTVPPIKSTSYSTIQESILQKSLSAPTAPESKSISSILSPSVLTIGSKNSTSNLANCSKQEKLKSGYKQNLKLQQPSLLAQLNNKTPKLVENSEAERTNQIISGVNTSVLKKAESNILSDNKRKSITETNYTDSLNLNSGNFNDTNLPLENSIVGSTNSIDVYPIGIQSASDSTSNSSMSSQPSGDQEAGKSATKMSIDHQATLDKGLKMKIKRTKPGTKTSEAKHEIVKAEQNGTSTGMDVDNNSSSGNSILQNMNSSIGGNSTSNASSKKHNNNQSNESSNIQSQLSSVSSPNASTTNKRNNNGHKRDKAREKQPHSKDKSEHNNNNSNSSSSNCSNSSATSSLSNSTNNDRHISSVIAGNGQSGTCNCSHEINGNNASTTQSNCSSSNCVRNRSNSNNNSLDQSLNNRLAGSVQSNNLNSQNVNSLGLNNSNGNSLGLFNSSNNSSGNNNSNNIQSSNNNSPNAPGPPGKEGKTNISSNNGSLTQNQNSNQVQNSAIANSQLQQSNNHNNGNNGLNPNNNSNASGQQQNSLNLKNTGSAAISATVHHTISVTANSPLASGIKTNCDDGTQSPPTKRIKTESKEMVDVCIGTSVGTITEPDCLGPCEPGTSVTLEGIVWHETEGGVLVVNVTWRGKTYVGTLLDCTRHDWAPPRFCDSPTEELDSRTPKGRAKRGRSANLTPDLSNFTETRSSVHSKLRNGGAKGRGGRTTMVNTTATTTTVSTTTTTSSNGNSLLSTTTMANASGIAISSSTTNVCNTTAPSPTGFLPPRSEKRKSKDESPSPVNGESATINSDTSQNGGSNGQSSQIIVNPITGLNVHISNKKCKTASPCAISPVLLECPEQDCNKKYKHANGLRYHQSHAHGSSGSMDEDSSTLPESPTRVAPPTTPPAASNGLELNIPTPITPTTTNCNSSTIAASPTTSTAVITSQTVTLTTSTAVSISSSAPIVSTTISGTTSITAPLITPIPTTSVSSSIQPNITPHPIAGGSITAGISGQALSAQQHQQQQQLQQQQQQQQHHQQQQQQHQQQHQQQQQQQHQQQHPPQQHQQQHQQHHQPQIHSQQSTPQALGLIVGLQNAATTVPNQGGLLNNGQLSQEQQIGPTPLLQQTPNNLQSGIMGSRGDQPIKPGVLRFVPPTADSNNPTNLTNQQSPLRSSNIGSLNPNSIPDSNLYGQHPNQQVIPLSKNQNFNKQKKNRKSPIPGEFDTTSRDDAHSPAYSDISDDSPSGEIEKPKSQQLQDIVKKSQESGGPPPINSYGMFQFYAQQPQYMVPQQSDHQSSSQIMAKLSQPPPTSSTSDFNKNKEPPLDLITKPSINQNSDLISKDNSINNPPNQSIAIGPGPTGKPIPHFYPFNYMPAGYPYNVDPNYGPVPMISDDNKMNSGPPNQPPPLKDDRNKESPSPHGHHDIGKITGQSPQMLTNKMLNQQKEQQMKDMNLNKDQNSHGLHAKESSVQSLGSYSSIYQRHPNLGIPQQSGPPSHMSRDEDLRRYFIYPDQRRSNQPPPNNNPPITTIKEEPHSPQSGQNIHHPSSQSHQQSPQQIQQQNSGSTKTTKSTPISNNNQKPTNLIKEIKEEKDVKIKQEGQKPTMETQGPPPPPTSQYFLHPSYISPGPYGFDPNHPMYRNVLMSAGAYNAPPYHLPMARFHAPEDLSRNPGTKALDALHQAASQYYTTHKIHELSERAIKSPTSNSGNTGSIGANPKVSNVSSPNIPQAGSGTSNISVGGPNTGNVSGPNGPQSGLMPPSNVSNSGGPMNLQPSGGPVGPLSNLSGPGGPPPMNKSDTGKSSSDSSIVKPMSGGPPPGNLPGGLVGPGGTDSRSPPPQRHVHTHHHTHVGLGYPMYPAPYGAAVLASQQAAAVAVINPFPPGPAK